MGECVHVRRPGEFNETGFRVLDKVIEVAHRKGIRVIIPFVDQAKWWGGIGEYAAFRVQDAADLNELLETIRAELGPDRAARLDKQAPAMAPEGLLAPDFFLAT